MELLAPIPEKPTSTSVPTNGGNGSKQDANIVADDSEAIVRSLFENNNQSINKSNFLGFRASGFKESESLKLTGIHRKTLWRWRDDDPEFVRRENSLPELRKDLGVKFAHMEFLRNFRLLLEKDYQVIKKSMSNISDPSTFMSKFDQDYLLKIRTQYTPQQFEIISALIGAASKSSQEIDFTSLVLKVSQSKSEISIEGKK
jgi:hypothetical protein